MHNLVKQQQQLKVRRLYNEHIKESIEENNSIYGEDSIEMASLDEDNEELYDQSNLTQRILEAERRFSTSSVRQTTTDYFDQPAIYRVLFMGSASEDQKKLIFKKLSQGFVQVLHDRFTKPQEEEEGISLLNQPILPFKEIKHNVLLLSEDDPLDWVSETYEDSGVSMIEADFTWSSTAVNYAADPHQLLLHYAWQQCPNPGQLPAAFFVDPHLVQSEFNGYMCPEKTPNGIDLCVYFYQDTDNEAHVKRDMQMLCTLRKFGIYVLPLTTSRDESLKTHFASLLTSHQVRCLDLGNLEVGQQPSFFYQPTPKFDRISRLQEIECHQLNVPRVAPYQILAIDQFCAIKNQAIFQLLKRTRERQVVRVEQREEYRKSKDQYESLVLSHLVDPPPPPPPVTQWSIDYARLLNVVGMVFLFIAIAVMVLRRSAPLTWTAEFSMDPDYRFTLNTKNHKGAPTWPEQPPQVWLDDDLSIPLTKIMDQPGHYRLRFDVLALNRPSFRFNVNTTLPISYITPVHSAVYIIHPSLLSHRQISSPPQPQPLPSIPPLPHHHRQKVKEVWDTAVFFISNKLNLLYKVVVVD